MKNNALFTLIAGGLASAYSTAANATDVLTQNMPHDWQLGMSHPASPMMDRLSNLHDFLLILITVITLFVMGLLAYVCVRFSEKNNPNPSRTTHNTFVEIVWTAVPVIILVIVAAKSLGLHRDMNTVPEDVGMTLKVVGHQWYWEYQYPDFGGFGFDSNMKDKDLAPGEPRLLTVDNAVVVPVNTVVRVQVTGADVIHSWAMPEFGVKQDGIPGKLNETWFKAEREGVFYGQCSELCGVNHGFMPIMVRVVSKEAFDAWVAEAKKKFAAGESVLHLAAAN